MMQNRGSGRRGFQSATGESNLRRDGQSPGRRRARNLGRSAAESIGAPRPCGGRRGGLESAQRLHLRGPGMHILRAGTHTARVQPEADAPEGQPHSNREETSHCAEPTSAARRTHDRTVRLSIATGMNKSNTRADARKERHFGRRRRRLGGGTVDFAGAEAKSPSRNLTDASPTGRHRFDRGVARATNLSNDWPKNATTGLKNAKSQDHCTKSAGACAAYSSRSRRAASQVIGGRAISARLAPMRDWPGGEVGPSGIVPASS